MKTRTFGPTSYKPTVIGLGGMPLSLRGRPERDEAVGVVHAALDAGMTLIDTADVYCIDDSDIGHNEQLIARALWSWSGDDDSVLICTKGGLRRPNGTWTTDGRPEHLTGACERSLAAMGIDRIAVYQLHAPDDDVPFADSVGALSRLREQGKVEHIGLSNVSADEIEEALAIVPVVSVQNRCNPFDLRAFESGVVAKCEQHGLAFLPYSPVGGGSGKGQVGNDPVLSEVGARHDASAYQVALAWLLTTSDTMFPIPGASRVASAVSSAQAGALSLSDEDVAAIDKHVSFARRA